MTVTQIVASISEAMKLQPLGTTVVVCNLLVLGMVYLGVQKQAERSQQIIETLITQCGPKESTP